jgi:glutamate-1-semialdehyde 2,1-aminomutase
MLEERAASLADGLREAAKRAGVPVQVNRVGSMLTVFFSDKPVVNYQTAALSDTRAYARFFHGMLERGVYLPPSQFEAVFVSAAHTPDDMLSVYEMAKAALQDIGTEEEEAS